MIPLFESKRSDFVRHHKELIPVLCARRSSTNQGLSGDGQSMTWFDLSQTTPRSAEERLQLSPDKLVRQK
jgi:hypothetical protein